LVHVVIKAGLGTVLVDLAFDTVLNVFGSELSPGDVGECRPDLLRVVEVDPGTDLDYIAEFVGHLGDCLGQVSLYDPMIGVTVLQHLAEHCGVGTEQRAELGLMGIESVQRYGFEAEPP
jgi:hypothetical protein